MSDEMQPELESIESFVQHCIDEERTEFTANELNALATNIDYRDRGIKDALPPTRLVSSLKQRLVGYGLRLKERVPERHVRGVRSMVHKTYATLSLLIFCFNEVLLVDRTLT